MGRQAKLEPVRIESSLRNKPWMLRIPPDLSQTGMREKLYFATEAEALIEANRLRGIRQVSERGATNLSGNQINDASLAFEKLQNFAPDLTLLEVVREWEKIYCQRNKSRTFRETRDEWFADPVNRVLSAKYLKSVEQYFERFAPLHDLLMCDIAPSDLSRIYNTFTPSSRNGAIGHLRGIFTFAVNKKYASENPFDGAKKVPLEKGEVEIFSNEEIAKLLNDALENDLDLLPYYVIGFFGGLRPEEELSKITWQDLSMKKSNVLVRAEIAKTGVRRYVKLSENAIKWLEAYNLNGGEMDGFVAPEQNRETMMKRRARSVKRIGIKWIHDGMRHTYCSNWLATYKDIGLLREQSGHNDTHTLNRHYIRGIEEQDAKAFWAIQPENGNGQVPN